MYIKKFLLLITLISIPSANAFTVPLAGGVIVGLIIFLVFFALYLLLFILTLKSIIISGNENRWKFRWVLIVIFLSWLGMLLYLIFGKRKKIPEGKAKEKEALLEEAPAKAEEKPKVEQPVQVQPQVVPLVVEKIPEELRPAVDYIKETRAKGFADEQIKDALKKSGWGEEQIKKAFELAR